MIIAQVVALIWALFVLIMLYRIELAIYSVVQWAQHVNGQLREVRREEKRAA